MNVDAFREMAAAMRSRQGFPGVIMRFAKTDGWMSKDADFNGAQLLALVADTMHGWVLWQDARPSEYHMALIRDGVRPPRRDTLGHTDKAAWRYANDPLQLTVALPLLDLNDGALYTYTTSSQGGRDCIAALLDAFSNNAPKLPLVTLSRDSYSHEKFGKVSVPVLDVIRWVEPPRDLKPIVPPAPPSGPLFGLIEHEHKPIRDDKLIEHDSYRGPVETDDIPF